MSKMSLYRLLGQSKSTSRGFCTTPWQEEEGALHQRDVRRIDRMERGKSSAMLDLGLRGGIVWAGHLKRMSDGLFVCSWWK